MSYETLSIMRNLDMNDFETKMAFQCAPVLAHLKASNLLIIDPEDGEKLAMLLEQSCFKSYKLFEDDQAYYLVYDETALAKCLKQVEINEFLKQVGYSKDGIDDILKTFANRFAMSKLSGFDFPHEMGFLLDYPYDDVMSFIEKNGADAKYIGYWKVYNHVDEAVKKFALYSLAEELAVGLVYQKRSVLELGKMLATN